MGVWGVCVCVWGGGLILMYRLTEVKMRMNNEK